MNDLKIKTYYELDQSQINKETQIKNFNQIVDYINNNFMDKEYYYLKKEYIDTKILIGHDDEEDYPQYYRYTKCTILKSKIERFPIWYVPKEIYNKYYVNRFIIDFLDHNDNSIYSDLIIEFNNQHNNSNDVLDKLFKNFKYTITKETAQKNLKLIQLQNIEELKSIRKQCLKNIEIINKLETELLNFYKG